MRHLFPRALAALLVFGIASLAFAEEVYNDDGAWGLNVPATWTLMQADEKSYSFSDSIGHAILQVFPQEIPLADGKSPSDLLLTFAQSIQVKLGAELADAGSTHFTYNTRPAILADMTWKAGTIPVRGYLMAIDGGPGGKNTERAFVVLSSAKADEWASYHDFLVSNLDSFFSGDEATYLPGPMSQLIANDGWSGGPIKDEKADVDAAQNVAEREARVLYQYTKVATEVQADAWRRFYQTIYRDNYRRLDDVYTAFSQTFAQNKTPKSQIPLQLLAWVQSFTYEDLKTLANLRAPVDAVAQKLGDCDARSLVYMILLDRFGFPSILMLSPIYQHSMVGVDMEGGGFRYAYAGKNWMVAETTAKVSIGNIPADMSDPKNWMGFDLHFKP